jgi:hypothetical protein
MSLASLLDFIINVGGLVIVVSLIFLALEQPGMAPDLTIKTIARYAVGGAAVLAFIIYCAAVFGGIGGAGAMHATPASIIEFAIGLIALIVVVRIIGMVVAEFAPANLSAIILFVVGAIAIIVILILSEKALFGGGLGLIPNFGGLGVHQQPTAR